MLVLITMPDMWCWVESLVPPRDVPHLTFLVVLFGTLLGVGNYIWTSYRERFRMRVDLILKLGERLERPEMREARAEAARALLANRADDELAVEDVLNFFEEIGYLYEKHAIDPKSIYAFFSSWMATYYYATEQYRAECQKDDPDVWTGFENAFHAIRQFKPQAMKQMTSEEIKEHLQAEAELVPVSQEQRAPADADENSSTRFRGTQAPDG